MAALTLALVAAVSGCSDELGSEEAFCRQVRRLPPLESVISGFSEADPAELANRMERAGSAYRELRSVAPSGIRVSVGDMVDLVDAVLGAVEAHQDDPQAAVEALRTAVGQHPDAPQASRRVVDYSAETCDVALNPTLDAETPDDKGTTPEMSEATEPSAED